MKDIDFLPSGYRQQHSNRNVRAWRFVVVASFLAMLSAASLVQYYRLCRARICLEHVTTQHDEAKNQNLQLTRLQSELKEVNCDAELFTYLRHPWPRTQILAAILTPLPPFSAPPSRFHAAGAFTSCAARFIFMRYRLSGTTPFTPGRLFSSATRSGRASTKIAFSNVEVEPVTWNFREARSARTAR